MSDNRQIGLAFAGGYAILFAIFLGRGYLIGDATFWVGMLLIPQMLFLLPVGNRSLRLAPVVIILLFLCCFRQEQSFRFLLLISAALLAFENLWGKLNATLFFVLLIISPLFRYLSEIFTFPIRLRLSEWAGSLLQMAHYPVSVSGNVIGVRGSEFSVDPACMGLQMTGFSLLICIFFMVHAQSRDQWELPAFIKIAALLTTFLFNIISNLMRIIALIVFEIPAENPLHEVLGIACLLMYALVPTFWLVRYLQSNFAFKTSQKKEVNVYQNKNLIAIQAALLMACIFFTLKEPKINIHHTATHFQAPGGDYQATKLPSGVTQFRNQAALVYVKPIPAFYSTEHSPTNCWTGSGYQLTHIRERRISGRLVYVGTLKKGDAELQTAWWFSNARYATVSQLDWRWKNLIGKEHFELVNVTTDDPGNLNAIVNQWLPPI